MKSKEEINKQIKDVEDKMNPFHETGDAFFEDWDEKEEKRKQDVLDQQKQVLKWILGESDWPE